MIVSHPASAAHARSHLGRFLFCAGCAGWWTSHAASRAATVAHWCFDEPAGLQAGSILQDAGAGHHDLVLGRGAEIVPGEFGQALRPIFRAARSKENNAHFTALSTRGVPHLRRAPFANVTDSPLNLGSGDWTLEGWFLLDPAANDEGVIFEIGAGPRGENELVTRLSVLPRENAFLLSGLAPPATGPAASIARHVEFANPEGPPGGVAALFAATLTLDRLLPRSRWFHVALVHTAPGELRLFLDGHRCATAAANLLPLPRGAEGYLCLGCNGRWRRPFPGAIDELRVSDHAVYTADFAPPRGLTTGLRR